MARWRVLAREQDAKAPMQTERRKNPRKKPPQLVYLELGADNGGMVRDISADGAGFRAMGPVRSGEKVPFAISLDGRRRLEGQAQLIWVDDSSKAGGLNFSEVSDEFREAVRDWLDGNERAPEIENNPAPTPTPAAVLTEPSPLQTPVVPQQQEEEHGEYAKKVLETEQRMGWHEGVTPRAPKTSVTAAQAAALENPAPPKRPEQVPAPRTPAMSIPTTPVESAQNFAAAKEPAESSSPVASVQLTATQDEQDRRKHSRRKWPIELPAPSNEPQIISTLEALPETEVIATAELPRFGFETPATIAPPEADAPQWPAIDLPKTKIKVEGQALSRAIAAMCVLALIAAVVVFRRPVGEALIWMGEKMSGEKRGATSKTLDQPAELPIQQEPAGVVPTPVSAIPTSVSEKSQVPFTTEPHPPPAITATPASEKVETIRKPQTQKLPPQKSQDTSRPATEASNDADVVQQLWTAVANGGRSAEVALGERYAKGDGVPQSCTQARVLLQAAANKGSAEAKKKLQQLADNGCS